MGNIFQGPYVYLPGAPVVKEPCRAPNDVTHMIPVWSIYDRTDYLVNLDPQYIEGMTRGYRVSAITEPARATGIPQNDSNPIVTPLAVWRSKFSLDRR